MYGFVRTPLLRRRQHSPFVSGEIRGVGFLTTQQQLRSLDAAATPSSHNLRFGNCTHPHALAFMVRFSLVYPSGFREAVDSSWENVFICRYEDMIVVSVSANGVCTPSWARATSCIIPL